MAKKVELIVPERVSRVYIFSWRSNKFFGRIIAKLSGGQSHVGFYVVEKPELPDARRFIVDSSFNHGFRIRHKKLKRGTRVYKCPTLPGVAIRALNQMISERHPYDWMQLFEDLTKYVIKLKFDWYSNRKAMHCVESMNEFFKKCRIKNRIKFPADVDKILSLAYVVE